MIQKYYNMQSISRISIAIGFFCACLVLQGCNSVKKTLGIDRDPPNEYVVTPSAQPLEMPPDFSCLPTPMPGMERPQERIARQSQEEKFLGSPRVKEPLSPGQKALLMQSGAQPNQDDIRYAVDKEARMEVKKDKTVVEHLGIKKEKPKGEAVNPYEEAEKLKEKGLVNPNPIKELIPPSAERANARRESESPRNNSGPVHGTATVPLPFLE